MFQKGNQTRTAAYLGNYNNEGIKYQTPGDRVKVEGKVIIISLNTSCKNEPRTWVRWGRARKINTKLNENIEGKKKTEELIMNSRFRVFAKQSTKTTNQLDPFLKKKR